LGGIDNDNLPEYEEVEGVTTIPLPPLAPVLFAFLIWHTGKQGIQLFESWREQRVDSDFFRFPRSEITNRTTQKRSERTEESGKGKFDLLNFLVIRGKFKQTFSQKMRNPGQDSSTPFMKDL